MNYTSKMRGEKMYVVKRGTRGTEALRFDKITTRLRQQCAGLDESVDSFCETITKKVVDSLYPGIRTEEIDELTASIAQGHSWIHPDFGRLAARIVKSNNHKSTDPSFSRSMERIQATNNILSHEKYTFIMENAAALDNMIIHDRDDLFSYISYKTVESGYLHKITENGHTFVYDRPQYMYMRVAIMLFADRDAPAESLELVKQYYKALSAQYFTHGSPTLFNACAKVPQLLSCFVLESEDSIEGIMGLAYNIALISKRAGGIGVNVSNIRSEGAPIRGTGGKSNGLIPQLQMHEKNIGCWNQGGKRLGQAVFSISVDHADLMEYLKLRLPEHNNHDEGAKNLNLALWIPDLFFKRLEKPNAMWSLFCPDRAPGLTYVYGDEYEALYLQYEAEKKYIKQVPIKQVLDAIIKSLRMTGQPYILAKDHVNHKTNHKNLGTITCSNLCCEIMEYHSPTEYACCTLASINLPKFVVKNPQTKQYEFDFDALHQMAGLITRALDRIIDINFYPTPETERSNKKHRPIGIGVQGLADAFAKLRIPFTSPAAKDLNRKIAETIYHGSLTASHELAVQNGAYESFAGSPLSEGKFQFDLWREFAPKTAKGDYELGYKPAEPSNPAEWEELRTKIMRDGIRNSLLVAPMPTASTSTILGNNDSFEPFSGNIYNKKILSGNFVVINKWMQSHLLEAGLWDDEMYADIVDNNGSIQNIERIPKDIRELYKTVYEISQFELMKMAADRGAFICQSQSFNVYKNSPKDTDIYNMIMAGWKLGLKTIIYYLRTGAGANPLKVNQQSKLSKKVKVEDDPEAESCSRGFGGCGG